MDAFNARSWTFWMGRLPCCLLSCFLIFLQSAVLLAGFSVATDNGKVIILEDSVIGNIGSLEAQAVIKAGFTPDIVNATVWATMTTAQFEAYRGILIGDPGCSLLAKAADFPLYFNYGEAAINNAPTWIAAVTGNILIVGTDPAYHYNEGRTGAKVLIESGVAFAISSSMGTGAYICLSCSGGAGPDYESWLSNFGGTWKLRQPDCDSTITILATHPALSNLTSADLSDWQCSSHETFESFNTERFLPLAKASDNDLPYIVASGQNLAAISPPFPPQLQPPPPYPPLFNPPPLGSFPPASLPPPSTTSASSTNALERCNVPCDPYSSLPNRCCDAEGLLGICCPGACGNTVALSGGGSVATCLGPGGASPINYPSTSPSIPPLNPTESPSPSGTPAPTVRSELQRCSDLCPDANFPNRCCDAVGLSAVCCPAQCGDIVSLPGGGSVATCQGLGGTVPTLTSQPLIPTPSNTRGTDGPILFPFQFCDPDSDFPNRCYNVDGSSFTCCGQESCRTGPASAIPLCANGLPGSNFQHFESHAKPPEPSPKHPEPHDQHPESDLKHPEPTSEHNSPHYKHTDPFSEDYFEHSEPNARHNSPHYQHTDPFSEHSEPIAEHTKPGHRHSEPSPKHPKRHDQHTESDPKHTEPHPQHNSAHYQHPHSFANHTQPYAEYTEPKAKYTGSQPHYTEPYFDKRNSPVYKPLTAPSITQKESAGGIIQSIQGDGYCGLSDTVPADIPPEYFDVSYAIDFYGRNVDDAAPGEVFSYTVKVSGPYFEALLEVNSVTNVITFQVEGATVQIDATTGDILDQRDAPASAESGGRKLLAESKELSPPCAKREATCTGVTSFQTATLCQGITKTSLLKTACAKVASFFRSRVPKLPPTILDNLCSFLVDTTKKGCEKAIDCETYGLGTCCNFTHSCADFDFTFSGSFDQCLIDCVQIATDCCTSVPLPPVAVQICININYSACTPECVC
ncbi:hypothetical protein KFL_002660140 [Klebsormidium nitens]|uniref:Uncharacterized protein n=1 Tax=Klebsormidium nitens TaxID=105231 RepID=A0A1Y1I505_KLENI|nr:hypothetical protein KFL_002660140 [Klebsormidium nitens]|eukprot:GAQ86035.1 hypothetical protein KFL_002660140 [Klebsormidium nitens]